MKWFRLYHDLPNDRKLRKFNAQQKWAWVVLLCLASESKQRGFVLNEDEDDLADYCGFDCTQDYLYFVDKLRQKSMIEHVEGGLKIVHWEERQYIKPSDLPEATRERKRRQRAKEAESNESMSRVTLCDEGVTMRDVTPPDPESYTDPESDQIRSERGKEESESANADSRIALEFLDDFEDWWIAYRDFCSDVETGFGVKHKAKDQWIKSFADKPEELSDFLRASEFYFQQKRLQFEKKGEAIGVAHAFKYIRDGKWQEVLHHMKRVDARQKQPVALLPQSSQSVLDERRRADGLEKSPESVAYVKALQKQTRENIANAN